MLKVTAIYIDGEKRMKISAGETLCLAWSASSDISGSAQASADVKITQNGRTVWAKVVKGRTQSVTASSAGLVSGYYTVTVALTSDKGEHSEAFSDTFFFAALETDGASWIAPNEDTGYRSVIFTKSFNLGADIKEAHTYISGLGYYQLFINGSKQSRNVMAPAFSDYRKTAYCEVTDSVGGFIRGTNTISIKVAPGWRKVDSPLINTHGGLQFGGELMLFGYIDITFTDGTSRRIPTDESWSWTYGREINCDIYNGETFDASAEDFAAKEVVLRDAPCEKFIVETIPPIREHEIYNAKSIFSPEEGVYVFDFGQNIAGVPRITLPAMTAGQTITVTCHEILDEDGSLYTATLRYAKCTDTYIASGDSRDLETWQPAFTYQGFRYALVRGWTGVPSKDDISAVALYSDVASDGSFTCGSALLNAVQHNIVMTEKANIHSILTDCPQRDERMGWMNDATVRFTETPYNFNINRLFPKVVRDLIDTQEIYGAIRCTAPTIFGGNPADPVCSSFLVAGYEAYRATNDVNIIEQGYDGWVKWENILLDHHDEAEPYIVNYSYYGDWAGPAYACVGEDGANSSVTPGIYMSSCFSYFNCTLLSFFADKLGRADESAKWLETAEKVKSAILAKWWDPEKAVMATGSQACQAFALKLGLIDDEHAAAAAKVMRDDLANGDYRITTGNLCTLYMLEALTKYGYIDDAYELMTREEYPSYGYMIQNEATTVWERFEFKKAPGMNSHNHPMFGSVGKWFYSGICGAVINDADNSSAAVNLPALPEKLLSASCVLDTLHGDFTLRWAKRFGASNLYLGIPFGMSAEVDFLGEKRTLGSGWHIITVKD